MQPGDQGSGNELDVPSRSVWPPVLVVLAVTTAVFGWPMLIRIILSPNASAATMAAVVAAPVFVIPGMLIALRGAGSDIPAPGDYVLEDPDIVRRYRRVFSLQRRTVLFTAVAGVAILVAITSVPLRNVPLGLFAVEVAVLSGGIATAMRRSTQIGGSGPRLSDRLGVSARRGRASGSNRRSSHRS